MDLLLLAGSIVITGAVFLLLVRVIKATLKTALLVAAIVFGLQFFGIRSDRIMSEMQQIFRYLWRLIPGQQSSNLDGIIHQFTQVAHSALERFSS
ncbi:MAG: hypothetical protein KME10_07305 [Plectolyngbya sp. WJT66-NPBG17]|jgi:hypothetical protein|nr:hypothetical protein [Plectolyngbya sp. WJT66-NPBG17]MBW4525304.1 hypothetical protein [Phormidium tanganyikae FI6-MK23]